MTAADLAAYPGFSSALTPIAPGLYATVWADGVLSRKDVARLSAVAASLGFAVIVTSGACGVLDGAPHHTRLHTIDVRTRGLSEGRRLALGSALRSQGYAVFYHDPANPLERRPPHFHLSRPTGRPCRRYPEGCIGGTCSHTTPLEPKMKQNFRPSADSGDDGLTLGQAAAVVAFGAIATGLGALAVTGTTMLIKKIRGKSAQKEN